MNNITNTLDFKDTLFRLYSYVDDLKRNDKEVEWRAGSFVITQINAKFINMEMEFDQAFSLVKKIEENFDTLIDNLIKNLNSELKALDD